MKTFQVVVKFVSDPVEITLTDSEFQEYNNIDSDDLEDKLMFLEDAVDEPLFNCEPYEIKMVVK